MIYRTIGYDDRKQIAVLYAAGGRVDEIADAVGVSRTTLYAELKRGQDGTLDDNQRLAYDATLAQRNYQDSLRRRGRTKPDGDVT